MVLLALLGLFATPSLDRHWTFKVAPNVRVEATNVNGRIRVEAASDAEVFIQATSGDPGDLQVRVEQDDEGVFAKVCCHESCDDESGRDDRSHRGCDGGRIDLLLRVPAGAGLMATNVAGKIEVVGVRGEQRISNVSGPISLEGSEAPLRIRTVSGRVRISPSRMARASVHSVSGDLELALPRNSGASIALETLSGEIETTLAAQRSRENATYEIRGGGPRVDVHSVSGSVRISDR